MSSCPSPTIIQDLILEAKEEVNQVKDMLMNSHPIADKMLHDVLQKLSRISALDSGKAMSGSFREGSVSSDDRKSENSVGKRKLIHGREIDQKRGVAGRRRSQVSSLNTVITKNLDDDGHTWRKYGQKEIQGSTYPKSYFRCTHKPDQGCMATRHVQPTDEDPCTFNVTYIGDHTCRDPSTFQQIIELPDPLQTNNSFIINFGSPNAPKFIKKEAQLSITPSSFPPFSGNSHEDVFSNLTSESSPVDQAFVSGNELAAIVGPASQTFSVYDQGEMMSSLHSSPMSLDLEFMPSSIFGLDHDEYSLFGFDNEDGDFLPRL
ncbi:hypothetical protein LUZ60_013142 [Juncus effusus]|nr:hypothetical protein LUZ60_013142 [Juncus effusus]